MKDHATKGWLDPVPHHADTLRTLSHVLVIGLLVAAAMIVAHVVGTWTGTRDAILLQQAERRAAAELCAQEGAVAYVDARNNSILCVAGSNRLAPLADPLKGPQ